MNHRLYMNKMENWVGQLSQLDKVIIYLIFRWHSLCVCSLNQKKMHPLSNPTVRGSLNICYQSVVTCISFMEVGGDLYSCCSKEKNGRAERPRRVLCFVHRCLEFALSPKLRDLVLHCEFVFVNNLCRSVTYRVSFMEIYLCVGFFCFDLLIDSRHSMLVTQAIGFEVSMTSIRCQQENTRLFSKVNMNADAIISCIPCSVAPQADCYREKTPVESRTCGRSTLFFPGGTSASCGTA